MPESLSFEEYQQKCLRTDMSRELPEGQRVMYHTMKVAEEVDEVIVAVQEGDWDKVPEERGDVLWHLACLADALNIPIRSVAEPLPYQLSGQTLNGAVMALTSVVAKHYGQRKPLFLDDVRRHMSCVWEWACGGDYATLSANNIAKLRVRYPDL